MLNQKSYDHIVHTIDSLEYPEQMRLLKDIKRIIHSKNRSKTAIKKKDTSWIGCLSKQTKILGDIVAPAMDENQWEVLSE